MRDVLEDLKDGILCVRPPKVRGDEQGHPEIWQAVMRDQCGVPFATVEHEGTPRQHQLVLYKKGKYRDYELEVNACQARRAKKAPRSGALDR